MGLLLAVDVGNSGVHCGVHDGATWTRTWRSEPRAVGLALGETEAVAVETAIACSVAPTALSTVRTVLAGILPVALRVLDHAAETGIVTAYERPETVGMDRLVACRAAAELYPPRCLVIDLGTAITFDVVDAERGHLGGAIGPGVGVSARALAQRAELLRPFELKPPTELIARSTGEGLRSGFVYGFAAMLDGMVRRLRTQVGEPLRVVATGGDAALIVLLCEEAIEVNDALVLEGLRLIATAGV